MDAYGLDWIGFLLRWAHVSPASPDAASFYFAPRLEPAAAGR